MFGEHGPAIPANYALEACTEHPGPVRTQAGYDLLVTTGLGALERADTVLVPGWQQPAGTELSTAVVEAVRRANQRGARIVGLCSGAFVLAAAGLLDGRRAATHWAQAAELAARFPQVRVDPAVLYVDHGDVATSAGSAAGVDLCLHLVSADRGAAYAMRIARTMVMPPHREGARTRSGSPRPSTCAGVSTRPCARRPPPTGALSALRGARDTWRDLVALTRRWPRRSTIDRRPSCTVERNP